MFSVIYYQLFRTGFMIRIPCYFKLIVLSLHLKPTPLSDFELVKNRVQEQTRLSSARTNSVRLIQVLSLMNELDSIYIIRRNLVQAQPYGFGSCLLK